MTDTPVRLGPSDAQDAVLAVALLPVLAALPLGAFWLGAAVAEGFGSDSGGCVAYGALCALVIGWGVPVAVAVLGERADYRLLPISAAVAPFALPVVLCLAALG
ncbi:hypothetical protein ACIRST_19295 [Kitasatospora sp. NPDC101447]|uniref:hypothetical protein n=1 Tax=Kitasatospora sp. NPDC101447 TaxID=3364102 RepID=UPI003807913A